MRSLLFDEIAAADMAKLREHLARVLEPSNLGDVYWLNLPPDLLSAEQLAHAQSCGPHRLAVVLEGDCLRLEFLVRSAKGMRCPCIGYASKAQRDFALRFADRLLEELAIGT